MDKLLDQGFFVKNIENIQGEGEGNLSTDFNYLWS